MWPILATFLAFLPERWRREYFGGVGASWRGATVRSGMLETGLAGFALYDWYITFSKAFVAEQVRILAKAGGEAAGVQVGMGMGTVMLLTFLTQPGTLALGFFLAEGIVRAVAAGTTEEFYGTAPLALADYLIRGGRRRAYEKRVPLVADLVTPAKGNQEWRFRVESCRPKKEWLHPKTVLYQDEILQVCSASWTGPVSRARPHVYLLRTPPPGEVIRGYEPFDPQAVLHTVEEGSPHVFQLMIEPVRNWWRLRQLPLVADKVMRGDGRQGWHLRVESCRPKLEWKYPRTICFEEQLFRVESSYETNPPRPYGYRLKRLPENEAARGVLAYSPEDPLREK